jgi:Family of unknown function (DUF5994)
VTSVRATSSDQGDARSVGARDGSARLSLKPKGCARGALDGAWWPRSTDPAIELTALIEAVGVPIRRIALNMAGWDNVPRRILRGSGERVAVDWFRIPGVHLVRIVGTDDQRIDLLLIPVDTEEVTAERALVMAIEGHDPNIAATVGDHSAPAGPAAEAKASSDNHDGAPDRHAPTGPGRLLQRRRPPASLSRRRTGTAD